MKAQMLDMPPKMPRLQFYRSTQTPEKKHPPTHHLKNENLNTYGPLQELKNGRGGGEGTILPQEKCVQLS